MATPVRFGPFWLDARLAVGGTAEVYLARPVDPAMGVPSPLVVKRLLPHFLTDTEGKTMFEREARLHAAVTHENVVTVFFAGHAEDGEPYLAMELIDGVDGYKLLRGARQEGAKLAPGVAVYAAREVCRALESVHAATGPTGSPLGIVHRDVSPSNVYFDKEGRLKLGDFGIARSTTRVTLRSESGAILKGKFAYLAPEQVAGEKADHRADLFSLGSVLAEMLLGEPLFQGGGQLAVLLAIRDCRLDRLEALRDEVPPGLLEVMAKALAREPDARYATARELFDALAPFEPPRPEVQRELARRVQNVLSPSVKLEAARDSVRSLRAATPLAFELPKSSADGPPSSGRTAVAVNAPKPPPLPRRTSAASSLADLPLAPRPTAIVESASQGRTTSQMQMPPSFARTADGRVQGPWTFAKLMEALATGGVGRGDEVDFMGRGFRGVEEIAEFARFLPPATATTSEIHGVGVPDFGEDLSQHGIFVILVRILRSKETGVLFLERDDKARKELYFTDGKLHHVASSDASELLGMYLVRRGKLAREELDVALAVMPRYGGRMGDTLVGLGLVDPVDIFRAIREQGRDRVADVFGWRAGKVSFYRGQQAPHVEFPLDLDIPRLLLAGLETQRPGDEPVVAWTPHLDTYRVSPGRPEDTRVLRWVQWPPLAARLLSLVTQPSELRSVIAAATRTGDVTRADAFRALEMLQAARMLVVR